MFCARTSHPFPRRALLFAALVFASSGQATASEQQDEKQNGQRRIGSLDWHTDYQAAYRQARDTKKMLFLFFRDERQARTAGDYESKVLASGPVLKSLERCVRVVLPLTTPSPAPADASVANISFRGATRLIDHPAFRHQAGRPGIAIIDLVDPKTDFYGRVVSAHPFSKGTHYTAEATRAVLALPQGTITQRTMLFVIRTHPERPRSTDGRASRYLFSQARRHCDCMSRACQCGHQNWDSRFQEITAALGGLGVKEVAATGNGATLVDAARDCVASWRSSPGHWSAVRGWAHMYGYDVQRGRDGTWYATGILAYPD
jgi:hypothetical protein